LYCNGKPLHHLDSARSLEYKPKEIATSSVFVVDAPTFRQMSAIDVQNVFRYRHILVTGVESEKMEFDQAGMSTLGSLTQTRHMQGM
jgi:hypothetical protein